MTADLREQLQATLGSAYTLERELGGGGMARVFVATEAALGRRVVVKVLPPEASGAVSADRFRREVQLAARLQHPHIVPLLSAGETAAPAGDSRGAGSAGTSLLYYTMPYVEGESLRGRLTRETQLPVGDAVRIACDVAEALDYAHALGVVHRDIKPENILLAGGGAHAMVADFGIARAVSLAAEGTLTATGLTLGTPRYMSPEQAAAERDVDGRSDVYSLGVVLYEMLAGEPPFSGPTAQAAIARMLSEPVPSVRRARASVPISVERAITRALAKVPADRFRTAAELRDELTVTAYGADGVPVAPPRDWRSRFVLHRHTWRRTTLGMGAVALFILLIGGWMLARIFGIGPTASLQAGGVLANRERILIADFRGPPSDTLLGAVMTEALSTDLGQSRALRVVSRDVVGDALRRMTRNPAASLDLALAREVAVREGIKAVLDGEITAVGGGYVLTARLVTADSGETLAAFRESAASADSVIPAIDRLSKRLRARVGESLKAVRASPPLDRATTASLPALRKYVQALRALNVVGDFSKGITLFEEAIALDSSFASAYWRLGGLLASQTGDRARMFAMLSKAFDLRDRLPEWERHLAVGEYYLDGPTPDAQKVIAAYEAALELRPDEAVAANTLGLIYGAEFRDFARAAQYHVRALANDSSNAFYYSNLARAQISQGKLAEAGTTIAEFGKRVPTHPRYFDARYRYLFAAGELDSASAVARSLWAAARTDPVARTQAAGLLASAAMTRGKISEATTWLGTAAEADRQRGLAGSGLRLGLQRAITDIWFLGRREQGAAALDALVAGAAFDSIPAVQRPYDEFAIWYAESGKPARARALLTRMAADSAATVAAAVAFGANLPAYVLHQRAQGAVALAERRYDEALVRFRESDRGMCAVCALPEIARVHDLAGHADSAIAVFERYLETPSAWRGAPHAALAGRGAPTADPWYLAAVLKRLAELYEARGDRQKARSLYTRFVELWKDADPDLQPQVADVRRRLARLREPEGLR